MTRRQREAPAAIEPRELTERNEATAVGWFQNYERTPAFAKLARPAQRGLEGAVRILARHFTHRWSRAASTSYPLSEMTPEDVANLLTDQLPRKVSVLEPATIVDALIGFLVWATRTGAIRDRDVEYTCRKNAHAARTAMLDERKWSPGKTILMLAMRDGVQADDSVRVREHAIRRGLEPTYVDDFLPAGPVLLESGEWLGLSD
jgi:hypothetical protein